MSTFEPTVVLQILKAGLPVKEQKELAAQWKSEVSQIVFISTSLNHTILTDQRACQKLG